MPEAIRQLKLTPGTISFLLTGAAEYQAEAYRTDLNGTVAVGKSYRSRRGRDDEKVSGI